jgi:hypothetical protein
MKKFTILDSLAISKNIVKELKNCKSNAEFEFKKKQLGEFFLKDGNIVLFHLLFFPHFYKTDLLPHHLEVIEDLGKAKDIILSAYREMGKSTLVCADTIRLIIKGKVKFVVCVGSAGESGIAILARIKKEFADNKLNLWELF